MKKRRIVLASGSPRRIEIMERNGIRPEIIRPRVEESVSERLSPKQVSMYLALKKALWAEQQILPDENVWVIAADTIVYCDEILGKPKDEKDAWRMLRKLRGRSHQVMTGVALLCSASSQRMVFSESTKVFFRDYSDRKIAEYIESGEVWDKAGAYAIQGGFHTQVASIEGDYDNVVGFPWQRILTEWKRLSGEGLDFLLR